MTTDPTTTPTPEQLRADAATFATEAALMANSNEYAEECGRYNRAALALKEQAARRERELSTLTDFGARVDDIARGDANDMRHKASTEPSLYWRGLYTRAADALDVSATQKPHAVAVLTEALATIGVMRDSAKGSLFEQVAHELVSRSVAPTAELRGWGVMRKRDNLLLEVVSRDSGLAMTDAQNRLGLGRADFYDCYRAVPVRLVADG